MFMFNQLLNDFLHLARCFVLVSVKEELSVGESECIEGAPALKNDFTVVPLNPIPLLNLRLHRGREMLDALLCKGFLGEFCLDTT